MGRPLPFILEQNMDKPKDQEASHDPAPLSTSLRVQVSVLGRQGSLFTGLGSQCI